jgi:hypothetical protein
MVPVAGVAPLVFNVPLVFAVVAKGLRFSVPASIPIVRVAPPLVSICFLDFPQAGDRRSNQFPKNNMFSTRAEPCATALRKAAARIQKQVAGGGSSFPAGGSSPSRRKLLGAV